MTFSPQAPLLTRTAEGAARRVMCLSVYSAKTTSHPVRKLA